jgi:hypothetical protein
MPAPMMAPIPKVIRWNGPSARLSPVSLFSEICIFETLSARRLGNGLASKLA